MVTGGTRGLGAAISSALLHAGASVMATYHANDEAAQGFMRGCEEQGVADRLSLHRFDVADPEAVGRFFGGIDDSVEIVVNNSGIRQDGLLGLMSQQAWERVIAVNLTGVFNVCKLAVRAMMTARYGRIINITSPSGRLGFAGQANYAASKAGLVALTRSLAREVAQRGITVNCVRPGFVLTDLTRDLSPEKLEQFRTEVPMKRFGEPAEVAAAVVFLASREASYISGAVLDVTGAL